MINNLRYSFTEVIEGRDEIDERECERKRGEQEPVADREHNAQNTGRSSWNCMRIRFPQGNSLPSRVP